MKESKYIYSDKLSVAAHQNIKERDYWLEKLSGELAKSHFPYDYDLDMAIAEDAEKNMQTVKFSLTGDLFIRSMKLISGSDFRLHMLLTTVLIVLLEKYTCNRDIVIGAPIYKHEVDEDVEFVNTVLALRHQLDHHLTFKELLLIVRQTIVEATENYSYPIEILIEQLNLPTSPNHFPLFDTVLLLENIHDKSYLSHIKINMIFSFKRTDEALEAEVEYNPSLYRESTIQRISGHFTRLMHQALLNVNSPIGDINILPEEEKKRLLWEFNNTQSPYPQHKSLQQLVEERVERTPNYVALVFEDRALTYRVLNQKANQLAGLLRGKKVGPGSIVGIIMEPSLEMIISILAVWKAGGAYLPLNPQLPQQRILSLLSDSGARVLLSKNEILKSNSFSYIAFQDFEMKEIKKFLTPPRPQIRDLDSLQKVDRSLVNYEKYHPYIGQSMVKNSITLQFSRGCVYKCLYCFKIWPDRYVLRSGENLFEEVNFYYKMGIRRFGFTDDLPNFNKEESGKFYRLIIKNGLKVHLHFPNGVRGDILSKDHIDLMVEAGVITMDLGLETASRRLQRLLRKNVNIEKLRENVQYIIEKYPHVILGVQIMHGFPTETEEEALASLEFIKSFRWLPFGYMHILKIYPNTPMARFAVENGISWDAIIGSVDLAYHELPETLPFEPSFTRQCQSEYLNGFFLSKDRLLKVLPHLVSVLTENELVQKFNSYLPVEVRCFPDFLNYVGIEEEQLKGAQFLPEDFGAVPDFNEKLRRQFPVHRSHPEALRILLLDLSQHFSHESLDMYSVVDPPLGLMYLLTSLNRRFGASVNGKIAKSMIDFDSYDELRELIEEFRPDVIGIRALTFFKEFFHKTISLIRQWGIDVPIITGGPYTTSSYQTMLQDANIDLAVLGEGEATLMELVEKMIANGKRLPDEEELKGIPGLAFIEKSERGKLQSCNREVILLDCMPEVLGRESVKNPIPINTSRDLSYIIYTSGSTGTPKGVMIEHRNVVNQITGLQKRFELDSGFHYLLLASFTFDVSVMHIGLSLTSGAKLFLIDEETRQDPSKLWRLIAHRDIDLLNIVPAYMKVLLGNIPRQWIHFKYLFVGGDVFDRELYAALKETFGIQTLLNIYGPTETTINATLYKCGDSETGEIIPIGKPLINYSVYILDKYLKPVPVGIKGELCISGQGVGRGYLNRIELTWERFIENPFRSGERLYKTGDLTRWLPDGAIEFLGRIDQQVKIRGFRIEPGEVKNRLLDHNNIKDALVTARTDKNGDKYLCAYFVSDLECKANVLRNHLAQTLPDYMIPSYFIQLERIPLTSNGKVDLRVLPEYKKKAGGEYAAPRNLLEKQLVEIWSEVLGTDSESLGIDANFFELGGHSLKATILIATIHKMLKIKIPLIKLFRKPTIRGLSAYLKSARIDRYASIEEAEKREYYPSSSAQKRLYILQQMDTENSSYNMPMAVELEGRLNTEKMEQVMMRLIQRHESLRTSFQLVNGEPVQRVHADAAFKLLCHDLGGEKSTEEKGDRDSEKQIVRDFVQPFELGKAPLLRAELIISGDLRYIFLVDTHHIISDGISGGILAKEFMALYGDQELAELRIQYRDYSEWQNSEKQRAVLKRKEEYWLNEFKGDIPVLELPMDFSRPLVQSFAGSTLTFEIDKEQTKELKGLALTEDVTLYMLMLGIYEVLLAKISGQEDIVVGTPIAGRRHADLERIIGMFVNTLALRSYPAGEEPFRDFLKEVKSNVLKGSENQEYQFEDLVEKADVARDVGRNPLFDVMFSLDNINIQTPNIPEAAIPGLKLKQYDNPGESSKFDMSFLGLEDQEKLIFTVEYCVKLFKRETIEKLVAYFKRIASYVQEKPDCKISDIEFMTEEEKGKLLYDFNHSAVEYPQDKTIHEWFEAQAERTPDNTAVVFKEFQLTYKELNKRANGLAKELRDRYVKANSIVSIMVKRSIEMVVGILGILKSGGAYLPIEPDYPKERIDYLLRDSESKLLLVLGDFVDIIDFEGDKINLEDESLYHTEGTAGTEVSNFGAGAISSANELAYIIYTSGSTGLPKGVMIDHAPVSNILFSLYREYQLTASDVYLLKTPYIFDVSVIELFSWFIMASRLVILDSDQEKDPESILDTISRTRVALINFVPSMFRAFLSVLSTGNIDKLSSLKFIFLAGEALMPEEVNKFRQLGSTVKLENLYGPTEAAIYASGYSLSHWNGTGNIPIGRGLANITLYILGKYIHLQPLGVWGELCISGAGVARGYLNNPELTGDKFIKNPFSVGERMYRSGDRVRWLANGDIEFSGRLDNQVKIRGYRIELGEIESYLVDHDHIIEAVVIAVEEDRSGEAYICAYFVSRFAEELDINEIREYLAMKLPGYMIPSYFQQIDKIPLTSGGKVDRKLLPAPGIQMAPGYTAPRDQLEMKLVDIWAEVLGVEKKNIGIEANFFNIGGHSLKVIFLASQIHKNLDVNIPLVELFKTPDIKRIAQYIRRAEKDSYVAIEPIEKSQYYPLSSAQKRLYILQQMEMEIINYNMPIFVMLEGRLDTARLNGVLKKLINRHESFRASFMFINGEPIQKIASEVEFEINYQKAGEEEADLMVSRFIRPFDLNKAPLLRAQLIQTDKDRHIFMLDMHHIISDGISLEIFVNEVMAFYGGEELPPLRIQYKDFSEWQNCLIASGAIKKQEEYWLEQFGGEIPVLNLPIDYPRPLKQSFAGQTVDFGLDLSQSIALKKLALGENATQYMVLTAIFNVLLGKVTGQEDIIIGSPVVGRQHADLKDIIGMFVNILPLRNLLCGEQTFREFLKEVKKRIVVALENQHYQFEDLVEKLDINRDASRNPLFDVVLSLEGTGIPEINVTGLTLKPYEQENKTAKFDMHLYGFEMEDRLNFALEYSAVLFKKQTMLRLVSYFQQVVDTVIQKPDILLADIEIITFEERRRVLYTFNDTKRDYPKDKTLRELFELQVEKNPDKIAICFLNQQASYRKLNEKANQLARTLREKNVGTDSNAIVGIMAESSVDFIVGIFGILKAGGVCLPIDPQNPKGRIQYLLNDANANVLLSSMKDTACPVDMMIDFLHLADETSYSGDYTNLEIKEISSDVAYIIYSSGTTGKPKGSLIMHYNIARLVKKQEYVDIREEERILQLVNFMFDVSIFDIFAPLLNGATLLLVDKERLLEPGFLRSIFTKHSISMVFLPTLIFNILVASDLYCLQGVRKVLVGGEALSFVHTQKAVKLLGPGKIVNAYSPSECTVYSITHTFEKLEGSTVPLGNPVTNSRVYVLDKAWNLLPVGITGDIYIAGEGVSRGYLNRPELTDAKFLEDPFMPGERLYISGDLGRWMEDGNIEFLGRRDHQVQIRGLRIELGEIETQLVQHEMVKEAVVLVLEDEPGDKYLCAYVVLNPSESSAVVSFNSFRLREYLSGELPSYMVPSFFVELDRIPLTPNGKVDRRVLPEPQVEAHPRYTAPRDEIEDKLAGIWSEILGIDKSQISIDAKFFDIGGHSLKATLMTANIHKELNVKIPLGEIFIHPSIREIAEYIKHAQEDVYASIMAVEEKEYYPVSSAQKRMVILNRLKREDDTSDNAPNVIVIKGKLNIPRFENAITHLIQRHDSLRTSFALLNDAPVQQIHEKVEFNVNHGEVNDESQIESIIEDFIQPFDLSKAPLIRVRLVKVAEEKHIILYDIHHIITDGISTIIFIREFAFLYEGEALAELRIQYKDFTEWQIERLESGHKKQQEQYWLDVFSGDIPVLTMPTDFPRPEVQSFDGNLIIFELDGYQTEKLYQVASESGATLYMVLLSILNILLHRYTGQEDIVIGSSIAGRPHADLKNIIGFFVNTLAIRNYPQTEKTFAELLTEVKMNCLKAYENQDYQFDDLINRLGIERKTNRSPLFDIHFTVQNVEDNINPDIRTLTFEPYTFEENTTQFDIIIHAIEKEVIAFKLRYSRELFKRETIEKFIKHFKEIVFIVIENQDIKLKDITISHRLISSRSNILANQREDFVF